MLALLPFPKAGSELIVPPRPGSPVRTPGPEIEWEKIPLFGSSTYTPKAAFEAFEVVCQVFQSTVAQCAVDGLKVIATHSAWRNAFGMKTSLPTLYDFMVETGRRMQGAESYRLEVRRNLGITLRETPMVQADLSRVRFGIGNSQHLIVDSGPNYAEADRLIGIAESVFAGVALFFRNSSTDKSLNSDPNGFIFSHALKANVKAMGWWEELAEQAEAVS